MSEEEKLRYRRARRKQADSELKVAAWNLSVPDGAAVRYWSVRAEDGGFEGEGRAARTRSAAFVSASFEPVVFITGQAGYVHLDHVKP